jgi:hypothetical protein
VEISPAIIAMPVVTIVSQATRDCVSCSRIESSIASEIWSATLSGCPSETDSEVKRYPDIYFSPYSVFKAVFDINNFWKTLFFGRYYTISQEKPYTRVKLEKMKPKKMVKTVKKTVYGFLA